MAITKKKAAKKKAGRPASTKVAQDAKRLATENVDLQRQLDEANEALETLEKQQREDQLDSMLAQTDEVQPGPEPQLPDPELLHDPFAGQNPHAIKHNPPGFVLGWKSERYRGHRGWRGWERISYDDEYGQNLDKYINDPPRSMEHGVDRYVRRGDVILCRLPVAMWKARQQQRVDKANRLSREHAGDLQVDHVSERRDMASGTDAAKSMLREDVR